MNIHDLYALANLLLCSGIAWSCICRLNSDLCRCYMPPRARYTLMLTGSTACGLSPLLFSELVGLGTVLLSMTVAASLAISALWWPAPENTPPDCHCPPPPPKD